jgi:hypothetical protein
LKSGARHLPEKPNEIKGGRANIGINRPMNRIRSRIVGALARCVAVQVTARSSRAFAGCSATWSANLPAVGGRPARQHSNISHPSVVLRIVAAFITSVRADGQIA